MVRRRGSSFVGACIMAVALGLGAPMSSSAVALGAHAGHSGPVWLQVSGGGDHTCAVRVDHSLWCWGSNYYLQLGLGHDATDRLVPNRVHGAKVWAAVS